MQHPLVASVSKANQSNMAVLMTERWLLELLHYLLTAMLCSHTQPVQNTRKMILVVAIASSKEAPLLVLLHEGAACRVKTMLPVSAAAAGVC